MENKKQLSMSTEVICIFQMPAYIFFFQPTEALDKIREHNIMKDSGPSKMNKIIISGLNMNSKR